MRLHAVPQVADLAMDRLAMDVVRATEAAAIAASRWAGRGDKDSADAAAVAAMREVLADVPIRGTVVIGEGEKDDAPMLHNGEPVGSGTGPEVDVAVDPVDGTTLTAKGMANALSVLALAPRGAMRVPTGVFYLDKLACGPAGVGVVDLRLPPAENVRALAAATGRRPADIGVAVLDRPRHDVLAQQLRQVGARVHFFSDGDVAAAVLAAGGRGEVDLLLGVGGTPEGVITACAVACLGGVFQGRLAPRSPAERDAAEAWGLPADHLLGVEDLVVGGHAAFVATGITGGSLLAGVVRPADRPVLRTTSLVLTSHGGAARRVISDHRTTTGDPR
jgi:fructose-1,6-bisphosphatase II